MSFTVRSTLISCMYVWIAFASSVGNLFASDAESFGSVLCGPNCVNRVLEAYGQDEKFDQIVMELQWPNIQGGTSFERILQALEKRGIASKAVRFSSTSKPSHPFPMILYLRPDTGHSLGHFVLFEPSRDQTQDIWDSETRSYLSWSDIRSRWDGQAILTAPTSSDLDASRSLGFTGMFLVVTGAWIVIAICYGFVLFRQRIFAKPSEDAN